MIQHLLRITAASGLLASVSNAALVAHFTFDDSGDLGANTGSASTSWNNFSGVTQDTGRFGAGSGNFTAGTSSAWDAAFNVGADLSDFTMSLHVKAGDHAWNDYISIGTGNSVVHVLEQTGAGGVANYNIGDVGGDGGTAGGYNDIDVTDGAWHHLGLNVSDGTARLFVDGEERASAAYTGSGLISAFQIGSRFGDGGRAINATLDDVAIYDTALSENQMNWLSSNAAVANPVPEPGVALLGGFGLFGLLRRRRA